MNRRTKGRIAVCHAVCRIFDSFGLQLPYGVRRLAEIVEELEQKFPCNRAHSDRVVEYAKAIVAELPIPDDNVATICHAACLHDVGKIGIPGEILRKPGPLTARERDIVRNHPRVAADLLRCLLYPEECIELIYYHHEWFNGHGYPCRAGGKSIPLGARVIAVADAFDAMTSDRPYRQAMTIDEASRELQDCAGSQFDPEVVEALTRAYEKGALVSQRNHQDRIVHDRYSWTRRSR